MRNRWKTMLGITAGILFLAGAGACSQREVQNDDINPTLLTAVSFSIAEEEMSIETRSLLTASDIETKKTGITLAAFRDGSLYCKEHFSSNLSDVSIPLEAGSYTVYALVNMGDMTTAIPSSESGMVALTYQIPSYTEGDSSIATRGMPMAGSGSFTITSSTLGAQTLSVKRLLCKVEATLNCSWPGGQLLSAKVFNMNKTLSPFGENGSAAASSSDILSFQEVMDGPTGTTFSATFYVPENMQGNVPGVTNSSDKRPDGGNTDIYGKKDLLTFLQVEATGSTKYVGTVTYRSYLGNNATSNFDLARNTRYIWTINYQENGLLSDNWKVDRYLIAEPEAIDLGLSVKWASFNLGALSPEDYGEYYAWGETMPKDIYDWTTYKWCNGSETTLTKYNTKVSNGFVDNKMVLEPEDDVAHFALGGKWRMPTDEEWTELQDNCTWTWITVNGVNGRKITSNKAGYTDKWIFLPAAGCKYESDLHSAGLYGVYWSSSLNTNYPYYSWNILFSSSGIDIRHRNRCDGSSVRPVYDEFFDDEIVDITYSKPSITLSYDPSSFDADGGTAIPTVSYSQEVTYMRASGAISTEQITSGGEVTFNMEAVAGFTLESSNGIITVAQNNTTRTRSTTITVSVTLNGETGTSDPITISQLPDGVVDLGLSVIWGSRNVGADSPEDYGDYFAWGETAPKTNYDWSTYKWCKGSYGSLTKYCFDPNAGFDSFVDNKDILDLEDDAAQVVLGGKWRMPTEPECQELRNNCTLEWTKLNGVNGIKFTSNRIGFTDKWIFLPAAGCRSATSLDDVGATGLYWSSSIFTISPHLAYCLLSCSNEEERTYRQRFMGFSVRPVFDPTLDEIVDISYSTPSVTLSYDPVSFGAAGGTAIPTVSYSQEVTYTRASGSTSTEQITSGGEVTFNMETVAGFTLDASTGTITVERNTTAKTRSTTVMASVTINGETGTSEAVTISQSPGTPPIPEAIDLGLSVKWASFNLWASQPEEYGEYFAWGEIEPKDNYSWSTYKWCNGNRYSLTKYNNYSSYGVVDNKTVLDLQDDAANVSISGKWRMPTDTEWTELRENCTWEWTTLNGVNGRKVTSNKAGYTDKWLFLPAAGNWDGIDLCYARSDGYYWSSSRYTGSPIGAWCVGFTSSLVRKNNNDRFYGFSVRPVLEDEIVSVSYGSPSVTLSYDPVSFDADGGTAIPTVSYTQEVTTTRASGATSTVQITTGGEVTFNMQAAIGFALDSTNGRITVLQNYKGRTRSTTVTVSVTLNGETGTSEAVTITQDKGTLVIPEAIDLGLSVKWASFNVWAPQPELFGEYYAWGETAPKDVYDWTTYKWCEGSATSLTKYNTVSSNGSVDDKTVLDLEDDAAHVVLGGKWRIPTDSEWTELRNNCTWEFTTLNGVDGCKCTSNKPGFTDKWIFLPSARFRVGNDIYYGGPEGYYWSSSLSERPGYSFSVHFGGPGNVSQSYGRRDTGRPVRPVLEDEIVSVSYGTPSVTLSYDPDVFDANGGTVIPTVSYSQEVTYTRASGAISTEQITTGGEVSFELDAVTGFTLDSTNGRVTVAQNNTAWSRIAIVIASVMLNGKTGSSAKSLAQEKGTPAIPEAIDLGLSVKWASFNLFALQPEEYGEYYSWGETEPRKNFNWTYYKWGKGVDNKTVTKYNTLSSYGTVDNKTVLDPEDDAAHVALGSNWRMPTDAEWTELRENCTWEWTTLNGVNGRKATSNKSGYTNKWIFLPAAGIKYESGFKSAGSSGYYWSSSLDTSYPTGAYSVYFSSASIFRQSLLRYRGYSVRPVTE